MSALLESIGSLRKRRLAYLPLALVLRQDFAAVQRGIAEFNPTLYAHPEKIAFAAGVGGIMLQKTLGRISIARRTPAFDRPLLAITIHQGL